MQQDLVTELRRRISDVRFSQRAFDIQVVDADATSAFAEITAGHLMISVSGGKAPDLDLDLTNPRYDTIGKLLQAFERVEGYQIFPDENRNEEALAIDLEPFGPIDIRSRGLSLRHHVFSDDELLRVLSGAVTRHNPTFTPASLPPQEGTFVLQLAQADICRIKAYDASKRRGMDADVENLLALAASFEQAYRDDTRRLTRAIVSPKEANPNLTGVGDIVTGKIFRRSTRTGFMSPLSQNTLPASAVLLDPDDRDIEDINTRVNWERNPDEDFFSYELWMDFRPEVQRTREGLNFAMTPVSYRPAADQASQARQTTSVLAFRSFGSNSNFNRSTFSTFVEEFGQLIRSFVVGPLEPETTYYFRLYIIDINYEAVASNVLKITTKPMRCKFTDTGYADSLAGAPGSTLHLTFDSTAGAFTSAHRLYLGEKQLTVSASTSTTATVTVPSYTSIAVPKDLSVISPTGLVDVRRNVFQVTA